MPFFIPCVVASGKFYQLINLVLMEIRIWYKSLKSLPVQSVLRVPIQKVRPLNGMETEQPFLFRSV